MKGVWEYDCREMHWFNGKAFFAVSSVKKEATVITQRLEQKP